MVKWLLQTIGTHHQIVKTKYDWTPLHCAAQGGNLETTQLLVVDIFSLLSFCLVHTFIFILILTLTFFRFTLRHFQFIIYLSLDRKNIITIFMQKQVTDQHHFFSLHSKVISMSSLISHNAAPLSTSKREKASMLFFWPHGNHIYIYPHILFDVCLYYETK